MDIPSNLTISELLCRNLGPPPTQIEDGDHMLSTSTRPQIDWNQKVDD